MQHPFVLIGLIGIFTVGFFLTLLYCCFVSLGAVLCCATSYTCCHTVQEPIQAFYTLEATPIPASRSDNHFPPPTSPLKGPTDPALVYDAATDMYVFPTAGRLPPTRQSGSQHRKEGMSITSAPMDADAFVVASLGAASQTADGRAAEPSGAGAMEIGGGLGVGSTGLRHRALHTSACIDGEVLD